MHSNFFKTAALPIRLRPLYLRETFVVIQKPKLNVNVNLAVRFPVVAEEELESPSPESESGILVHCTTPQCFFF